MQKKEKIIMNLYTMILLAVNSIRIVSDSIWGDEGFSIMLATSDISYLLDRTSRDVHPPLYYLILKGFFGVFGATAMMGKLLSFLAIAIICLLAVTYFYKRFGAAVAMIIVGVVTFTGNCINMIVEIRMYTLAMLFLMLTLIFVTELLYNQTLYSTTKKILIWIGLSVSSLAAAYTHYYALITVAILDAVFFIIIWEKDHKSGKYICGSLLGMILGYLPWLFVLVKTFQSVASDYWIADINIKSYLMYIFGNDFYGFLLLIILAFSVIFFFCTENGFMVEKEKQAHNRTIKLCWKYSFKLKTVEKQLVFICLVAGFGTILVGVAVSYIFRPLYVDRYVYPAIGLIAVALGVSFVKTFKEKILIEMLLVLMGVSGISNFNEVRSMEATYMTETTKEYLYCNLEEEDVFLTDNQLLDWTVLRYYFPNNKSYFTGFTDLDHLSEKRIWLMLDEQQEVLDKITALGYHAEKIMETGIENVFFDLYLLTK